MTPHKNDATACMEAKAMRSFGSRCRSIALFGLGTVAVLASSPVTWAQGPPGVRFGAPVPVFPAETPAPADVPAPAVAEAVVQPAAAQVAPAPPAAAPPGGMPAVDSAPQPAWADWTAKLPYRRVPPLGNLPVLPSGPGYYSLQDALTGNVRPDRPESQGVAGERKIALNVYTSFDLDYRYLDDPNYVKEDIFDYFHNIHLGDNWLFGTGGQFDTRYMNQRNDRLSGVNDDYQLFRVRTYADLWYRDQFRIFGEMISATSTSQTLTPLATDRDAIDFLNLFVSVKLFEVDEHGVYVTVGRQEQLIGSQRLITPLEWVNTRKTYDGVHVGWSDITYDFDAFWVQPVIPNANGWSGVDHNQQLASIWTVWHPDPKILFSAYWLYLDDENITKTLGIQLDPTKVHTLGARAYGQKGNVLWDVEPMLQVGVRGTQDILAYNVTAGLGYNFPNLPLDPTFWAYYDKASGDHHPGTGDYTTFNEIYAFGHYYLGFMDLIGRANIQDVNFHLWLYPNKWVSFNLQYHILNLDSAVDALYGVTGTPSRYSPTGAAGTDVGQELTTLVNFHLTNHSDVLIGWSELFAGSYIRETATTAGGKKNPELFYVMYNFRW